MAMSTYWDMLFRQVQNIGTKFLKMSLTRGTVYFGMLFFDRNRKKIAVLCSKSFFMTFCLKKECGCTAKNITYEGQKCA